jgi:hypothetical protein
MAQFLSVPNQVVSDKNTPPLLFPLNNSPVPSNLITVAPINTNNNVELAYSIISDSAVRLNEIINSKETSFENVRTVYFTRHIDCSLVADQPDPEYGSIKKWKICNPTNDYKKVIFAGPDQVKTISNNMDLFYQQTLGIEKSVHCWCMNNLYPSGFATTNINHDMSKYKVYMGKSKNGVQNARQFHSCYELIKNLKISVSGSIEKELKTIPRLEAIDCKNLQYTSYNKFTDTSVMDTVEQIIHPNVESKKKDDPYFNDVTFNNNFYNSLDSDCWDPSCGCTGTINHFDCVGDQPPGYDACVYNDYAITYFPYLTTTTNNFVNLQHIVYVDPFSENTTIYSDTPVLLKLIFNTQFYYNYHKLPQTIVDEDPCILRWNPAPSVYMPEPADYFLIEEGEENISCCT